MIKIEVSKNHISILGHANYDEYGKDIVCAAVSSVVMTSIEGIALIDKKSIDVKESTNKLEIIQNKHDSITDKLLVNMLNCLHEIEKKYPKNIKIINEEE